ncbi:uncharacterized protein LOC134805232 [Cydia splendana]|uniref:uncharacterized protein LOC134805232 n=1 Tax=Cydia splendana TaxID=1100963 RepID=UPI00300CB15A
MHPRSKHWHLLDYVIVRKRDIQDVLITRAIRGAEGWTDHRLIRSKLKITLKAPRRACLKTPSRLDTNKLVHDRQLGKYIDVAFGSQSSSAEPESVDVQWRAFATKLYEISSETIGKPPKQHKDWFDNSDPEIMCLVEQYRLALKSTTNTQVIRAAQRLLKAKLREQKDKWWNEQANELQHLADTNQTGRFFQGIQAVFGPKCRKIAPIYSRDKERRLTDKHEVLARWAEHFKDVLNPVTQSVDLAYIRTLKNQSLSDNLALPPDYNEYVAAVRKLKNNKTPGSDSLPAEIFKYTGPNVNNRLFELILRIWESETVPQDWRDASICKLYKGKGQISDCGSYRGISLLSTADLEKAFDRVPREALWLVLQKTGCPEKFVKLVKQFHENMMATVRHESEFSEHFPVTSGVKQGCVMAPTLFALYFSTVLEDSLLACSGQIQLSVRSGKSVFDLSLFKSKTKTTKLSVLEILYADDVCLMADSMEALQSYMDALQRSCLRFGLVISISKTQVLKQPARNCEADTSNLTIEGKPLTEVSSFKYLGSQIRKDNRLASEIPSRIAKAASTCGRLPKAVFYSQLSAGKRKQGGQHLRYKDVLKRHLTACGIPPDKWEELASQRPEWRSRVKMSVKNFEDARLTDLDAKRQICKSRPKPSYNYTYNNSGQLYCPTCDRGFKSKFGFASHIRAHARN